MPNTSQYQPNDDLLIRDADGSFKAWKDGKLVSVATPETGIRLKEMPAISSQKTGASSSEHIVDHDEAEIQSIRARMGSVASKADALEKNAETILKESGVRLQNADAHKRLFGAIVSRLRHLRDDGETRSQLVRSVEQGGLGLDAVMVERVMRSIKQADSASHEGSPVPHRKPARVEAPVRREEPPAPPRPSPIPPQQRAVPLQPLPHQPPAPPEPAAPQSRLLAQPIQPKPAQRNPEPEKKTVAIPPFPVREKDPPRPLLTSAGRPRVADVLEPNVLTGPVEELRYRLVDFRRLASKPDEAVKKIEEKLKLLGEDSFGDRVSGVLAWRGSEVYDLYLTLTEESLTSSHTVQEVIRSRTNEKKQTLTFDEYKAVVSLNRNVRF